jgi:hypothetical protein
MRSKGVFWGVLLIALGALFVLRNFGIFYFNWYDLKHLWPVILVILGISLLPIKGVVRIILSFTVVIAAMFYLSNRPASYYENDNNWSWIPDWHWNDDNYNYQDDEYSEYDDEEWADQLLYEDYDGQVENAVLDLDAAAGKFTLEITEDYLIKFERKGNFGKYYLNADNVGSAVVLKLAMESDRIRSSKFRNDALISLNPEPVWDINMDAGAAEIDFDLSLFKVDRIDINGGASSIWLKLGDKMEKTDLEIDTGASSIVIEVPEGVGCEVKTTTVLSSKELDGFDKIENGFYQTSNFDNSDKKIFINIDAAVASLEVKRY